jgi:hypothetical protein
VGYRGCSALQKSDFDSCSGGLRGLGVRDLAKKRLRVCSGGLQRVFGLVKERF